MILGEEQLDRLMHYGILRKSGRYPWGSGDTPHERAESFLGTLKTLRDSGIPDKEIAAGFGMTTSGLRDTVTIANNARKAADIAMAVRLKNKGLSNVAIGQRMNKPESTIRNLLKEDAQTKNEILKSTAEMLRAQVEKHKYVDVGKGVELHMNVSHEKLKAARRILEDEGYTLHYIDVEQLGTGKSTKMKVLAAPGTPWSEVMKNRDQIQPANLKSSDGGRSYDRILPPLSISSKRVKVRYAEEGGTDADGVIYVRRGASGVTLGKANYAQVRIAVDGSHYLKGMAMYGDDHVFPPGVDLVFNTNKSSTGNKLDAMKKMKDDPDDPFGATINRQIYDIGPDGNRRVSSVMNIVNEEGNWGDWSKNLSSQMLSKQPRSLAKNQLDMAYDSKEREFKEIMALENATVKRHMLEKFADSADASAVHLKAAHLPRQASHVILPVNSMKPDEVYAPNYRDGERVVLIRYPHGGIFEIPELKVNNRQTDAKRLLGNAPDAIGIHHSVAERLSGADFDGDTVLVIPNNSGKIRTAPALEGLKGFDPQSAYPGFEGMPRMTAKQKGREMGDVSNLITDMTIKGAPMNEIAQAVRHSMVVIDAEKHGLNWRQSALDNGIANLKKKYQGGANKGASTLVSRATSDKRVNDRKPRPASEGGPIDRATGKLVFVETGAKNFDGSDRKIKSTKLAETDDAHTLIDGPGTMIEKIYADHSNKLKNLANQARREMLGIDNIERSPSAAKVYAQDVKDLDAALNEALRNAPLERRAQVIANARYKLKAQANPDMDAAEIKKLKAKELKDARDRVGAKKQLIEISPRQWEAIQAGAISNSKLEKILDNTDLDKIKALATPKSKKSMSTADLNRAMLMLRNDKYSLAEVADQLGVSVSTLKAAISGGDDE
ncbi:helix-turn-helix DNA-binding domain protein [Streptomyces phage CricKo]|nr:helix-turn-helix DNA-binding domain protein [Streptomyces phage Rainydai]AWN06188.1 helix-turn-helix DNA-binding domain protein [Streptomyces phage SendItCS]QJD49976.1 helix-turn-helix DNA-binding domain protein [Streptomyces phage CricKo]QNL30708.1 helix-turn-helix DNA-binding domain protein [Streptomyces phage Thiqqums]WIC89424.1 helix-turn-helix DNA binding domain protein [Streptomyces phage Miek]